VYANERSSSIDTGLDYDSTVMLTSKLLFAAAKAIEETIKERTSGILSDSSTLMEQMLVGAAT